MAVELSHCIFSILPQYFSLSALSIYEYACPWSIIREVLNTQVHYILYCITTFNIFTSLYYQGRDGSPKFDRLNHIVRVCRLDRSMLDRKDFTIARHDGFPCEFLCRSWTNLENRRPPSWLLSFEGQWEVKVWVVSAGMRWYHWPLPIDHWPLPGCQWHWQYELYHLFFCRLHILIIIWGGFLLINY